MEIHLKQHLLTVKPVRSTCKKRQGSKFGVKKTKRLLDHLLFQQSNWNGGSVMAWACTSLNSKTDLWLCKHSPTPHFHNFGLNLNLQDYKFASQSRFYLKPPVGTDLKTSQKGQASHKQEERVPVCCSFVWFFNVSQRPLFIQLTGWDIKFIGLKCRKKRKRI